MSEGLGQLARHVQRDGGTVSTIKDEFRTVGAYETGVWHPAVCGGRIIIVGHAESLESVMELHERWKGYAEAGELVWFLEQFLATV